MEVPAKRARFASSDLELLDLDDDALIMIVDKLDHESKKQMMASCKRFELLIGHTHQFYKNFKFHYDQQKSLKSKEARYLEMVRRPFQTVEISGGSFSFIHSGENLLSPPILELLKKIGAHILNIEFHNLMFRKSDLCIVMKFLPKIRELKIEQIQFFIGPDAFLSSDEEIKEFELEELTTFKFYGSTNLEFFVTFVPSSLKILKIGQYYDDEWTAELLGKQKQLEELSIRNYKILDFQFDPENCHIKKLEFLHLEFSNDRVFEKFSDFLLIQDSVEELEFSILEGQLKNYAGILTHLINLKTLKKATFRFHNQFNNFHDFSRLKICNPSVETLAVMYVQSGIASLNSLSKFFPNVTDLKIIRRFQENDRVAVVNLNAINLMKNIRKFEIDNLKPRVFLELDLSQLQELYMFGSADFSGGFRVWNEDRSEFVDLDWTTFVNKHSQLKILHIPKCHISVKELQFTLENLKLLKSLEVMMGGYLGGVVSEYTKEHAERAAQLIGDNYDRFEHLQLNFASGTHEKTIVENYIKNYYPGVKLCK